MNVTEYAQQRQKEALEAARRAMRDAVAGMPVMDHLPPKMAEACLTAVCQSLQDSTRQALLGLRGQIHDERDLERWETEWGRLIVDGHRELVSAVLKHSYWALEGRELSTVESERACRRELQEFVASERARLVQDRREKRFQWKLVLVGALIGFVLGIAGTLLVNAFA